MRDVLQWFLENQVTQPSLWPRTKFWSGLCHSDLHRLELLSQAQQKYFYSEESNQQQQRSTTEFTLYQCSL